MNHQIVSKSAAKEKLASALSKEQADLLVVFGNSLRHVRSSADMTQACLAERVGLDLRTIQKWEAGQINVPLTTLYRIKGVLGCSWEALLVPDHKSNGVRSVSSDPSKAIVTARSVTLPKHLTDLKARTDASWFKLAEVLQAKQQDKLQSVLYKCHDRPYASRLTPAPGERIVSWFTHNRASLYHYRSFVQFHKESGLVLLTCNASTPWLKSNRGAYIHAPQCSLPIGNLCCRWLSQQHLCKFCGDLLDTTWKVSKSQLLSLQRRFKADSSMDGPLSSKLWFSFDPKILQEVERLFSLGNPLGFRYDGACDFSMCRDDYFLTTQCKLWKTHGDHALSEMYRNFIQRDKRLSRVVPVTDGERRLFQMMHAASEIAKHI